MQVPQLGLRRAQRFDDVRISSVLLDPLARAPRALLSVGDEEQDLLNLAAVVLGHGPLEAKTDHGRLRALAPHDRAPCGISWRSCGRRAQLAGLAAAETPLETSVDHQLRGLAPRQSPSQRILTSLAGLALEASDHRRRDLGYPWPDGIPANRSFGDASRASSRRRTVVSRTSRCPRSIRET